MLKLRIISAFILLPIVITAILKLPSAYVAVASGVVFAAGAWEWLSMIGIKHQALRAVLLLLLMLVAYSLLATGLNVVWVYWLALSWWLLGLVGICYYPNGKRWWQVIALQPFIGLIMFVPAWLAFNQLHSTAVTGPQLVLLGCALIWGADIAAYFTGKLWGKDKLIEQVSPGKTWAGFYGAVVSGCIIMSGYYVLYKPQFNYIYAIWLGLLVVVFAVIGDLVESLFKRVYGVKDSGKLIPGHGGVFDRIDSMLAAFPVYMLGLQVIQQLRIMDL